MQPYGYLSNYSNAVTPPLLDLILQNETGHLSASDRFHPYKSKSRAGAIGGYQLMPNLLHDYGYGMDPYIQSDALDPVKSRKIAGELIKGYSGHYGFDNLADTLIGYNMGAKKTSDWIKRGRNFDELPNETKAYLKRAKDYIDSNPEKYSIAKINQEIAKTVSNDNVEGIDDMNTYVPNFRDQRLSQMFIDGTSREGRLQGVDPYSEGFYPPMAPPVLMANNNNTNMNNGILNDTPTNANFMSANASTLNNNNNNNTNTGGFISSVPSPMLMKRRDNQELSKGVRYPEDIGLNEMLIRIGGAGQANAAMGGNRQIADATSMYGKIMDYNRSQALEKYKTDVAAANKSAKQARKDQDYLGTIDQSLADMDKALVGLSKGKVTGLWDGTVGSFIDSMTGDPKATTRLLLKKLKVDDTLLRIAQTKGAISNKEMDLFMSPAPSVSFDQEEVWERWINERKDALQRIKARLTGGVQVVPNQQASQSQMINGIKVTRIK